MHQIALNCFCRKVIVLMYYCLYVIHTHKHRHIDRIDRIGRVYNKSFSCVIVYNTWCKWENVLVIFYISFSHIDACLVKAVRLPVLTSTIILKLKHWNSKLSFILFCFCLLLSILVYSFLFYTRQSWVKKEQTQTIGLYCIFTNAGLF